MTPPASTPGPTARAPSNTACRSAAPAGPLRAATRTGPSASTSNSASRANTAAPPRRATSTPPMRASAGTRTTDMDIDTIAVGDMVVLPEGEHGRVSRIDLDDHVVY